MSRVPVVVDNVDLQESEYRELLALRGMRRDLERVPTPHGADWSRPVALSRGKLALELHELIEALDRRLPRVGEAGEASIARDAAALREKAVKRLAYLESLSSISR